MVGESCDHSGTLLNAGKDSGYAVGEALKNAGYPVSMGSSKDGGRNATVHFIE